MRLVIPFALVGNEMVNSQRNETLRASLAIYHLIGGRGGGGGGMGKIYFDGLASAIQLFNDGSKNLTSHPHLVKKKRKVP